MNIQNYLLCVLYIILIIVHSFTICHKDFYRGLVSIFTFALFTETTSTILETLHLTIQTYGREIKELTQLDLSQTSGNFHYIAQLIHITSINFFILFLLIIAKGWPITRREMPFKYAFAAFWLACLAADLTTFYWTTITAIARNFSHNSNNSNNDSSSGSVNTTALGSSNEMSVLTSTTVSTTSFMDGHSLTNLTATIIDSLPKERPEELNSTPRRLSLLLRIVIMLFFLLELRTTMILEQEKKKLQFYLHFGALTMVWFVHTLIVYIISLRVDSTWQTKLISGFSSAANFLGFAITTRLLWPKNSRSDLFRRRKRTSPMGASTEEGCELDNFSTLDRDEENRIDEYDGLQMRDLSSSKE